MTDDKATKAELKERIAKLEKAVYPSRRDMLKAGAGAAVGGAAVFGATSNASAGDQSAGVIGTQSSPVDAYVEDLFDHNGNQPLSFPGDGSVSIGDIDVGGADLASSGDFLAVGPSFSVTQNRTFSTTSTNYVSDNAQIDGFTQWDKWVPTGAQGAAMTHLQLGGGGDQGDVRLRNISDSETVQEQLNIGAGTRASIGPTNYTPTTTSGVITFRVEVRTDGSSTDLQSPQVDMGVQL